MKPLLWVASVMALTFCVSLDAQAQANKCVAKCAAYCNKHWPSGDQNAGCKNKCVTRHHC
jgi:hypothetical protein